MSITLTFHNFSEKKPAHNEQIIFLRKLYSFDSYGFDPRESTVEYQWSLVDSDGDDCGDYVCFDEDDPTPPELTEEDQSEGYSYNLSVIADGHIMEDGCYWCSVDEWFDSLPKE